MKSLLTIYLTFNILLFAACSKKEAGTGNEWYKNKAFVQALELSDFPSVSGYIYTSNIDVKSKDKYGDTPLTIAVTNTTNPDLIQTLIDTDIDAQALNGQGYSALMLAAKNNINPNISKAIILTGTDIEKADPAGKTPLILAATHNKNKNVPLLFLEAGAQGRESNDFKQAVYSNKYFSQDDKKLLLESKIIRSVKVPWYNSKEFKNALNNGDMKQLAMVSSYTDLKTIDSFSKKDASSLLEDSKNPVMLAIFAKNGVNLNLPDEHGKTMLYKAAEQGNTKWLKELLQAKANPNTKAKDGSTPLAAAAMNQPVNQENMQMLIKAGADFNASYGRDASPLISKLIEKSADSKAIEFLIKAGADINKKNAAGNTPLIIAAKNAKDDKIIQLLLANKADIDVKNGQGFTALLTAASNNKEPAVTLALLKKSENKLDTGHVIEFSARNPNPEVNKAVINYFLEDLNARKNTTDKNDASVWFNNKKLVAAIKKNNVQIIKKELKPDMNFDALMQGQFNALMLAAAFSKTGEPINLLVEAGADPNGTNNNGDTPLMTAVLTNKNLPVIQALVMAGADVNAIDKNGTSIIMAAANKNPNEKIPVFLLQSGATVQSTHSLLQYAQANKNKKVYDLLKQIFTKPAAAGQSKKS